MASNATDFSTIVYLNFITREFNRYIPLLCLVLGTIGNILNILVFSRPALRTNPCSLYFISGSLINFSSLYVGLITPFLGLYDLDPTQKSIFLCKLRFYLRYTSITLSTWFILFACVDRYFSSCTNVNLRLCSSIHFAKRVILLATIIAFLFPYTHVFYCYTINQRKVCTHANSVCRLVIGTILLLCNSCIPPILMVFISICTIRNVRIFSRISARRRRDVQLSRILFIQVILVVICAIPITVEKIYSCATVMRKKSELVAAIDSLASQISVEISYVNSSISFSVYSLTSKKFRKEVSRIFSSFFANQCRRTNTVQPITPKVKYNSPATIDRYEHKRSRSNIIISS